MRFIVNNVQTKTIIGGKDNLIPVDLIKTLREYMRVRPEGYNMSRAFMQGHWDGWRYFITPTGTFATGFLPMVVKYMEELGVEVIIEDQRGDLPRLRKEPDSFIGNIKGTDWYGFPYQMDMVRKLNKTIQLAGQDFYFPRGMYDCATNAGKNSISALIVKNLDKQYKTAFFVSSTLIYKQAVEFFTEVLGEPVGEIKSSKYNPKTFTVVMMRTMFNRARTAINAKKYLNDLDVVIVDESDEVGAKEYSKVLSMVGAGMRIFVSGTPLDSSTENNMTALGLSGQILGQVTNKFLIENGYSQKPLIKVLLNVMPHNVTDYKSEVYYNIHTSENRVELIIDNVLKQYPDKSVMITFNEKVHGYFMFDEIKEAIPEISMEIAHGTTDDRSEVIERFKNGTTKVLLASMIVKRGLNIPRMDILVPAQEGMSVATVKQILGRGLRKKEHDEDLLVFEFYDTGQYVSKHSAKRMRIYKKEELEIEYTFEQKRGHPDLEKLDI